MIDSALQKRTDQVTEIGSTLIPFGTAAYASFSCSPGSPTASQSVTCQSTRFAGLPQDAPRAVPRTSPITLLYSVDRKFGCAGEHSFRARVCSAGRTCTFTASTGASANTESIAIGARSSRESHEPALRRFACRFTVSELERRQAAASIRGRWHRPLMANPKEMTWSLMLAQ